jgi:hypothetical protein
MSATAFQRLRREQAAQGSEKEIQQGPGEGLKELRTRAKELGIPNAAQLGEKKLLVAIAEKDAEIKKQEQLEELRMKANEIGIEDAESKDAETLLTEISAKEAETKGGAEDAN